MGVRVLSVDAPLERMLYGQVADLRAIAPYLPVDDCLEVLSYIDSLNHLRDDETLGITVSLGAANVVTRLMAEG